MTTVIIGDGATGIATMRTLRNLDPTHPITLLSADPNPAYYRAALTNYLLGELNPSQLQAIPVDFFHVHKIKRIYGRAVQIDPSQRLVTYDTGEELLTLSYHHLVIATGTRASIPPYSSEILRWIRTLRTLREATELEEELAHGEMKHALIIGGGPLALEWAAAYHKRGVQVHLGLRNYESLMRHELNARGRDLLYTHLREHIKVHIGEISQVYTHTTSTGERLDGVELSNGERLEVDMIGIAAGITPNLEAFTGSGLAMTSQGVCVDRHLRTNDTHIFAGGDLAVVDGATPLGLWEPAQKQGALIAQVIYALENNTPLPPPLPFTPHYFATRLFHLDFVTFQSDEASLSDMKVSSKVNSEVNSEVNSDELIEQLIDIEGVLGYRSLHVSTHGELRTVHLLSESRYPIRRQGRALYHILKHRLNVRPILHHLRGDQFDLWGWIQRQHDQLNQKQVSSSVAHLDYQLPSPTQRPPLTLILRNSDDQECSVTGGSTLLSNVLSRDQKEMRKLLGEVALTWDGRRYQVEVGTVSHQVQLNGRMLDKTTPLRDGDQLEASDVWTLKLAQTQNMPQSLQDAISDSDSDLLGATQIDFTLPEHLSSAKQLPLLTEYALEIDQQVIPISPGVYLISRSVTCDVQLSHPETSLIHGEVTYRLTTTQDAEIFYRDLGSTNGTLLNGKLLNVPVLLRTDQILNLGQHQLSLLKRRARLEINLKHREQHMSFKLNEGDVIVVGRNPQRVHWAVDDVGVSGKHCELKVQHLKLWVRDLDSRNGVTIQKKPVPQHFVEWSEQRPLYLGKTCMITWEQDTSS